MRPVAAAILRAAPPVAFVAGPLACDSLAERPGAAAPSRVTVLYPGDEWVLSPAWDSEPKMLIFLPMVRYEEYYGGTSPRPALASRWEPSPDYRRWTVHVNPAVRWHDGTPVTAHDVKFTAGLWRHPEVLHYAGQLSGAITVLDDSTFTIDYPEASNYLLGGWDVYYPQHLLDGLDPKNFWEWEFWTRPTGNGPYRYVRHVPGTLMEFEANPDHYRGKPRVERVILKLSGATALTELLSGNVDVALVEADEAQRVKEDPRFRVYTDYAPHRYQLFWNGRSSFFRDPGVRRALTMAMDRRELHRAMGYPEDTPLYDGLCTNRQFRRGECGEAWPHDAEAARRFLEDAGWRDRDGDGVREREGTPFRFDLLVPERLARAAIFLQDQLRRVGVRAEVRSLENATVQQRLQAGDFQVVLFIMVNTPLGHLELLTDASPWGLTASSPVGYANATVRALLDSAAVLRVTDPAATDGIYRELGAILREEMPVTYLFPRVTFWAAHRRIRGLASPFRANPIWLMEELWIEEER